MTPPQEAAEALAKAAEAAQAAPSPQRAFRALEQALVAALRAVQEKTPAEKPVYLQETLQALEWALEDLEAILDQRYPDPLDPDPQDPLVMAVAAVGQAWEAVVAVQMAGPC